MILPNELSFYDCPSQGMYDLLKSVLLSPNLAQSYTLFRRPSRTFLEYRTLTTAPRIVLSASDISPYTKPPLLPLTNTPSLNLSSLTL
jgi:hypothetical protein